MWSVKSHIMITLNKRMKKLLNGLPSKAVLATKMGLDESILYKLVDEDVNVSSTVIEAFHNYFGWKFNQMFEFKKNGSQ
jgi:hypothetical protein